MTSPHRRPGTVESTRRRLPRAIVLLMAAILTGAACMISSCCPKSRAATENATAGDTTARENATGTMAAEEYTLEAARDAFGPTFVLDGGEQFGAAPDALGPLGGGAGYTRLVNRHDHLVATEQELIDALDKARKGETIYVADGAELDFSTWVVAEATVLTIPGGVTLAGGRGKQGVAPAWIHTDFFLADPVEAADPTVERVFAARPLIRIGGPNARVTGLRITGPDSKSREEPLRRWLTSPDAPVEGRKKYYRFPSADGILCEYPNLEVDNCELAGWSHGGVALSPGALDARVHHNFIHHTQRTGLGYGVVLDRATALIESNVFDYYRHAIAATGRPGTSYEAANNLALGHQTNHVFDMHGGVDRDDGTNIAGDWMKFHHNTVRSIRHPSIVIRGLPRETATVDHNWFLASDAATIEARVEPTDYLMIGENRYGPEGRGGGK